MNKERMYVNLPSFIGFCMHQHRVSVLRSPSVHVSPCYDLRGMGICDCVTPGCSSEGTGVI